MTTTESKYEIAIVMPVLNEEKYIGQTLDQIYMQDYPVDQVEIVIADGGSTDRTREIAESHKGRFGSLKVLDNPGRLPSSGRNVGIKNTTAPYILVLDGHTHISNRNLLSDMVEIFKTTGTRCLCRAQPLNPPDVNEFEKAVAVCRASLLGHNPASDIYSDFEGEVDPTSSGAMYDRTVFDEIGGFDENFDACEDVDFNYRLKKAGIKAIISPKLKVYYYPRSTLQSLWKQMLRYGRGRFRFNRKHNLSSPVPWLAAVAVMFVAVLILLSFFSDPVFGFLKNILALYVLLILAFSLFLAITKKNLDCLLYGTLIYPMIHFGLGIGFLTEVIEYYLRK